MYPGGDYANPQNDFGKEYVHESDTAYDVPLGSSLNISATLAMDSDINQAFQISQAVITAARYYEAMEGSALPKVDVVYPCQYGTSTFFYDKDTIHTESGTKEVYSVNVQAISSILTDRPKHYASWDAIMHEYGHHVAEFLGIHDNPGGTHTMTGNCIDLNRNQDNPKDFGLRLAWGEAYPTVFALLAQNYYSSSLSSIYTVGDTNYIASNHHRHNVENETSLYGDGCEGAILSILWHLFDNTPAETHDTISMSHASLWSLVIDSGAVTMFDFVCHYMSTQSISAQRKLGTLLSYHRISAYDLDYTITPWTASFSWKLGGASTNRFPNDSFDLVFCNANQEEVFRIEYLSIPESTPDSEQPLNSQTIYEYTLTAAEYTTIINECGSTFGFYVVAFQTDEPATGLYESEYVTVSIPN